MIVDRASRLGAYDFKGLIDGGIAYEWLQKLEKAFLILGLTEVEKVHGFVKGLADDWLQRIRHLYSEGSTWTKFVTEFHKEYMTGKYKKSKQEAGVYQSKNILINLKTSIALFLRSCLQKKLSVIGLEVDFKLICEREQPGTKGIIFKNQFRKPWLLRK